LEPISGFIQELLRHNDIKTTQRYLHVSKQSIEAIKVRLTCSEQETLKLYILFIATTSGSTANTAPVPGDFRSVKRF
jgi:hypothetical protein